MKVLGFIFSVVIISGITSYIVHINFNLDSGEKFMAVHECLMHATDKEIVKRPLPPNLIEFATVSGSKYAHKTADIVINTPGRNDTTNLSCLWSNEKLILMSADFKSYHFEGGQ